MASTPAPKRTPIAEAVSIHQCAQILGVHHVTVRRWIRRGFIKAHRVGPLIVRIPRSEIIRIRTVRIPATQFKERPEYPTV